MAGNLDIRQATVSDMENRVDEWEVTRISTDGISDQKETEWSNDNWSKYWGYFTSIPDLKAAILMKAIWNVGKGWKSDKKTEIILNDIRGWGKDTFDDILFNMEVIRRVGGDAFAEIITDDDGNLLNLKPLDPASIKIIIDGKGIIKRYEQINKTGEKVGVIKFKPNEIFHLSNNRLADQIHGISEIDSMEDVIKADAESFTDMKKIMHRQAKPMIMFKIGTDDQGKIDDFIAKMDKATNKGENIYVPDDVNSVDFEVVQVNVGEIIMSWRNDVRNKFYRALGLPQIIFGQAGSTESGGKMEYFAHEQVFEHDQRYLEKQIWQQLAVKIDLIPPTSLLNSMQSDQNKDAAQGLEIQPQDATAGKG